MRVRHLSVAAGVLLLPILAAAQSPASATPPRDRAATEAPTGTGRLRGRVVASDSGTPLRRAQVRATGGAVRTTRLTSTDAEGRYEFRNLPPGRYTITVNKAGYVGLEFGQRRPFDGGRPLDLAEGQAADEIDFALPRGSVITGRITDGTGEPVVMAWVQAMRYQYLPGGRRQLTPVESSWLSSMTNDLGEFRLFGLMPGSYIVSAHSVSNGIVSLSVPGPQTGGVQSINVRDGYLQTYFPGTALAAEAQPVVVNLSEEAQASFSLLTGRMSRISGIVTRSDGTSPAGWQVELRPNDNMGAVMTGWGNATIAKDGSFSFANVPPGDMVLEVMPPRQAMFADNTMSRVPGDSTPQEFARMPLTVGGSEIAGLSLTTRPGISVSGHAVFPETRTAKNADGSPVRINATAANPAQTWRGGMSYGTGVVDAAGRFQIRDVMGQVLFRPTSLPPNLVLRSVRLNGVDITDRPYDSTNGDLSGLEIVIAEEARVAGTARNARGDAMRDYKVALFPASAPPSLLTSRYMHVATADPNGRFHVERLAPGAYLGVAVESFDQGQEWDPAFQQRVLPFARRFSVIEGQTVNVELPYLE